MNRTRDYYRKQRATHIARKKRIIRGLNGYWGYEHEGELAKGKIHCSCPWCRSKSYDHKAAKDLARIEAMNESEKYYQTYGHEFEDYELSDAEWHWIKIEEYWYYEDGFYHDWLVDHPNSSTN